MQKKEAIKKATEARVNKENLQTSTALAASSSMDSKGFFCKVGPTGAVELRRNHDYFYQVQGTLAITKRSWCDFVVWTPTAFTVERISFDSKFWEAAKAKLIRFYKTAILPELALPRHTSGQPIREPCTSGDYAIATAWFHNYCSEWVFEDISFITSYSAVFYDRLLKLSVSHYYIAPRASTWGFIIIINVMSAINGLTSYRHRTGNHFMWFLVEIRKSPTYEHGLHEVTRVNESTRL